MPQFTPIASLFGGLLIGAGASLLLLFNGRIAGISGIAAGIVIPRPGEVGWRILFLAGLLVGGLVASRVAPQAFAEGMGGSWAPVVIAGFLVGFGTRLSSGCTSGHGVCGLARLSRRSLAATITFMAAGMLTVWLVHHLLLGGRR